MNASHLRRPSLTRRLPIVPLAAVLVLAAAACGGDDTTDPTMPGATDPAVTQPVDTQPMEPGWDADRVDEARENGRGLLGMNEDDLDPEVRVARRGEETFALTADYVLGRYTVELDDTDGSGYRVVAVTVELPDGPEAFELEAN